MSFPSLPPEIWELIICDYNLLSHMKTIKTIPSRHCIISTVYCQLIQQYIDHLCKLIYSININIIDKRHRFNKYDLINIIEYFNIPIEDLPKIFIYRDESYSINKSIDTIGFVYINKIVRITKYNIEYYMNYNLHRIDYLARYTFYVNGSKDQEIYYNEPAYIKWINYIKKKNITI